MINPADSIRYTNVLSRKYRFHYKDMYEAMEDFLKDIGSLQVDVNGPLFYSLNNVPLDEVMNVEFFIPVVQSNLPNVDDMLFHSYFSIENMVSLNVVDHLETNTEIAYKLLFEYMEEKKKTQVTPIFHILSGDDSLQYMAIKIGVK